MGVAINTGVVQMLPWEAILFVKGKMAGVREACDIPPEMLRKHIIARSAASKFLGFTAGARPKLSIKEMRNSSTRTRRICGS